MSTHPSRHSFALVLAAALAVTAAAAAMARGSVAAPAPGDKPAEQAGHDMSSMPGAADGAMAHEHMDMGPHMKMTAPRPRVAGDQRRAEAIAQTLRGAIARYRDYRVAVADGFIQYLPNVPQ